MGNPTAVIVPPSAVLSTAPICQHPVFQLSNIGIIKMPCAVDAASDMVDIRDNHADSGGFLKLSRDSMMRERSSRRRLVQLIR